MKNWKNTLKNCIKSLGFLLGLVVILVALSHVFERKDGVYIYDGAAVHTKNDEVNAEASDTIDVVFLGDSVCYSSFNPLQIYAECGYTSFVCGTSAQRLCDSYVILQSAFENQNPKVVVLEANCLYRDIQGKKETGDRVLNKLSERLAVFQNHSRWKDAASMLAGKARTKKEKMRGFVVRNTVKAYESGEYMLESSDIKLPDAQVLDYLVKIQELCKENGAALVLVSSPSPKNWNYEKHNGVTSWAQAHDVPYLDLNLENALVIDWTKDTKDAGDHLNLAGATKVSRYVGNWLKDSYALPDKRENPSYVQWQEDSLAFRSEQEK